MNFAHLLDTDPRARRKLTPPPIAFDGHGFQMARFTGGEGDYWDVRFPDCDIRKLPYFSLFESGGIESVSEAEGVPYMADRDHPWGLTLAGEEHFTRNAGRTRMFFKPDTRRLCIYPVNALGMPSFEPIKLQHVKGPCDITAPNSAIVVVSVGAAHSKDQVMTMKALGVHAAQDYEEWFFPEGSYGAVVWKV